MKNLIILFILSGIIIFSNISCQSDNESNRYKELLSGKYERNFNSADFNSNVTIFLKNDYTCSYTLEISADGDRISQTISGEWKFNEDNNTLTLILIDAEDNTRHEEMGVVNLTNKTIIFGNDEFKK